MQTSVIFSVLFEEQWPNQISSLKIKVLLQRGHVGIEVDFSFLIATVQNPVYFYKNYHMNSLDLLKFSMNKPATCKKFQESHLGRRLRELQTTELLNRPRVLQVY